MVINANYGSNNPTEKMLSNFYPQFFDFRDKETIIKIKSVENAIQAMKFDYDDPRRQQAFDLEPLGSKKLGAEAECIHVYWDDREIAFGSDEHHDLIAELIWAKFDQSEELKCRLLATEDEKIVHRVGPVNPRSSLPNDLFVEILTDIRTTLRQWKDDKNCKI